jgi:4a-hydroxytetrahydrobiopterin dehydratase
LVDRTFFSLLYAKHSALKSRPWFDATIRSYNLTAKFDYDGRGETFMSEQLADKTCVPCRGGMPPLKGKELEELQKSVPEWSVVNEHHLKRGYKFSDFAQALAFVNRVGAVAEEQGHHPDIFLAWGKAEITLWTHKIDGLTESDFIMAAKIDRAAG